MLIFDVSKISFVLFVGKGYTTCTISTTKICLLLTVFKSGVNGIKWPLHQDYQSAESVKRNKQVEPFMPRNAITLHDHVCTYLPEKQGAVGLC